ncbi:MAG: ABC transporter substrate-binding protein [Streptosporangiaceae bacterium]
MRHRARPLMAMLFLLVVSSVLLAACGGGAAKTSGSGGSNNATSGPQRGGEITVLEGSGYAGAWPTGLDPATNTNGAANQSYMSAIYGQLFQLGEGGKIVPDLATGYKFSDGGKTVSISLRKGVKFQDGTAFNAKAVAWNFKRDLKSPCTCSPKRLWPPLASQGITTPDDHTVVLHFKRPFAAVIHAFIDSNANWIASPAALAKMGEKKFKIKPVGAGPFEVVSDTLSSQLVLKRYDGYWKKGHPYLDKLTFKSIGGDQPAYQALLAGQAQAYEGMNTTPLIQQAQKNDRLTVTMEPPTSPYVIQLNTKAPPFDNKRAREAIYYATNTEAIRTHLFNGLYPVTQSFTGPGGLFFKPKVPGYRTYDLAKAKQIVKRLGGLQVDLFTIKNYIAEQVDKVLQSQWSKAGIKTTIHSYDLAQLIKEFQGNWEASLQTAGSWDPAAGVGVGFRFSSSSPFSGIHDPKLDKLLQRAAATLDKDKRGKLYAQAAKYISDHAYAPFLFAFAPANVVTKGAHGPGLTTKIPAVVVNPTVMWDSVWIPKEAR